jgi:hypothetical protein
LNTTDPAVTEFAPASREPMDVVRSQFRSFIGTHCRDFFDALPNMLMALNCKRQVVFANQAFVSFLGYKDVDDLLGVRPGEALGCVNANASLGGCGTSRHCRSCGTVSAILSAVGGTAYSDDCKLLRRANTHIEGLDIHVDATPILLENQSFVVVAITDFTHESRRRNMERIFFHDVLNLAGGINGLTEMLEGMVPDPLKDEFTILRSATESLMDEILAQRDINAAENNDLKVSVGRVGTMDILRTLRGFYAHAPVSQGRVIALDPESSSVEITTDSRLVQRVLGNMLKNALEALSLGGTAILSCREEADHVVFSVHNPGFIPQSLQDSIFRRTFSTKGTGRGMGIYSMLLLAERYLEGNVSFRSSEAQGTEFFLRIPKTLLAKLDLSVSVSS